MFFTAINAYIKYALEVQESSLRSVGVLLRVLLKDN